MTNSTSRQMTISSLATATSGIAFARAGTAVAGKQPFATHGCAVQIRAGMAIRIMAFVVGAIIGAVLTFAATLGWMVKDAEGL